jgi:VIT1/CCC1 family predicted Fe2+/Mn2+ transporter
VQGSTDPAEAQQLIAGTLPSVVAGVTSPADLEAIRTRLAALPAPPRRARLDGGDLMSFLGVFLLVFLSTFPVTIPFMLMQSVEPAMRVSNAIAIVMLFVVGYAYGRISGRRPILTGGAMVLLGGVLVAFTIALGG